MARAEVRTIVLQGAPGTEPTTNYELGADVEGVWLAFQVLGVESLENAKQRAPQLAAATQSDDTPAEPDVPAQPTSNASA